MEFKFLQSLSTCETSFSRSAPVVSRAAWGMGAHWRRRRHGPSSAHPGLGTWGTTRSSPTRGREPGSQAPTPTGSSPVHPKMTWCGGAGGRGDGGASSARHGWGILLPWLSPCTHKHNNTVDEWKFPKSLHNQWISRIFRFTQSVPSLDSHITFQHLVWKTTKKHFLLWSFFPLPSFTDYSNTKESSTFSDSTTNLLQLNDTDRRLWFWTNVRSYCYISSTNCADKLRALCWSTQSELEFHVSSSVISLDSFLWKSPSFKYSCFLTDAV